VKLRKTRTCCKENVFSIERVRLSNWSGRAQRNEERAREMDKVLELARELEREREREREGRGRGRGRGTGRGRGRDELWLERRIRR